MQRAVVALVTALGLSAAAMPAAAQQPSVLRIGLQDDPDVLDPVRGNTFVGRIVFAALCDKLLDINAKLEIVPQLATSYEYSADGLTLTFRLRSGARFHDGELIDAAAVKANIDRARTLPDSRRRSEIASVESVDVIDPLTVALRLSRRDATLAAQFTDRAGMMMSPRTFAGDVGARPVCSGPYRFVERVQNDRIVLERFREHWRADQYHFDRVIYRGIPDATIRLANLRAGDLDIMERITATDIRGARNDRNLRVVDTVSLGYQGLTINVGNGEGANNPLARDRRLRQALALTIDRNAINQVVFEGTHPPAVQPFVPASFAYNPDLRIPERDVARARRLMQEAGHQRLAVEMQVANNPVQQQIAQMIQAMASEAGFDIRIRATEFATLIREQNAGRFQVSFVGWSGRVDPDGNANLFWVSNAAQNDGRYSNPEVDRLMSEARMISDTAARRRLYDQAQKIVQEDMPFIYLYYQPWFWAMNRRVEGFVPVPDGMIRLDGVRLVR